MAGSGVELLFGPMLLGVLVSTAAYGIMTTQMLRYYQTYRKDATWIRYFILYLFLAETMSLLIQIGIIYEPLILKYGSPQALITSPLFIAADPISIVVVSTPIQMFTAWRISVITGSIVLSMIISVLSTVSFGGGLLVTVFAAIRNEFREFQSFSGAVILWLVCSAVCDVLIAVVLTYSLWSRKTGFGTVDGQINRIIRLSVQTGAITAVAAIADVLLFLIFPTTTLQFIPDFPLSKLYTICLLNTLNARTRGKSNDPEKRLPNALFKEDTTTGTLLSTMQPVSTMQTLQNSVHVNLHTVGQGSIDTLVAPSGRPFNALDGQPADMRQPIDMRYDALNSQPKMVTPRDARRPLKF